MKEISFKSVLQLTSSLKKTNDFDNVIQNVLKTNFCVFMKLILPVVTYSDLELFQSMNEKKDIYTNLHMVHRV